MAVSVVTADISGLLVLLLIIAGAILEPHSRKKSNSIFVVLCGYGVLIQLVDIVGYLPQFFHGCISDAALRIIDMFAFMLPLYMAAVFLVYLYIYYSSKYEVPKFYFRIGAIYCCLQSLFCLYYGISGKLFLIEDGRYIVGEYYNGYIYAYLIALVFISLVIIRYSKTIGLHDTIASLMFVVIPIGFLVLNALNSEWAFSIAAISLSLLIIYIMLQKDRNDELLQRESFVSKLAHVDELTGLNNRLAFARECDIMILSKDCVGVVFADVNGLKYANDHFGHKAGDELLKNFSALLLKYFSDDDVYRISGDEFVILNRAMDRETFEAKVQRLIYTINAQEVPIAAVGHTYGAQSEIGKLVDLSEAKMYQMKQQFYVLHPEYSRGK